MADSNTDGILDSWYHGHGIDPNDPDAATKNPDNDPYTTGQEWTADTDPTDGSSWFRVMGIGRMPVTVYFEGSANCTCTLQDCGNLLSGAWCDVPGVGPRPGGGPRL